MKCNVNDEYERASMVCHEQDHIRSLEDAELNQIQYASIITVIYL